MSEQQNSPQQISQSTENSVSISTSSNSENNQQVDDNIAKIRKTTNKHILVEDDDENNFSEIIEKEGKSFIDKKIEKKKRNLCKQCFSKFEEAILSIGLCSDCRRKKDLDDTQIYEKNKRRANWTNKMITKTARLEELKDRAKVIDKNIEDIKKRNSDATESVSDLVKKYDDEEEDLMAMLENKKKEIKNIENSSNLNKSTTRSEAQIKSTDSMLAKRSFDNAFHAIVKENPLFIEEGYNFIIQDLKSSDYKTVYNKFIQKYITDWEEDPEIPEKPKKIEKSLFDRLFYSLQYYRKVKGLHEETLEGAQISKDFLENLFRKNSDKFNPANIMSWINTNIPDDTIIELLKPMLGFAIGVSPTDIQNYLNILKFFKNLASTVASNLPGRGSANIVDKEGRIILIEVENNYEALEFRKVIDVISEIMKTMDKNPDLEYIEPKEETI